jgi:hypothetical protein
VTSFYQENKTDGTSIIIIELPNIERDGLRDVGFVFIFHEEVTNITSMEDVKNTLLYNKLLIFDLIYGYGVAKKEAKMSINL